MSPVVVEAALAGAETLEVVETLVVVVGLTMHPRNSASKTAPSTIPDISPLAQNLVLRYRQPYPDSDSSFRVSDSQHHIQPSSPRTHRHFYKSIYRTTRTRSPLVTGFDDTLLICGGSFAPDFKYVYCHRSALHVRALQGATGDMSLQFGHMIPSAYEF